MYTSSKAPPAPVQEPEKLHRERALVATVIILAVALALLISSGAAAQDGDLVALDASPMAL